jgi:hypothetical protein
VPSFPTNSLQFSSLGLRVGGGEGESKDFWAALLSRRMLAQGLARGNACSRKRGGSTWTTRILSLKNRGKVALNKDKIARTSTSKALAFFPS